MTAVERLIDVRAPVHRVWAALVDPAVFARCYASGGAVFEPRVDAVVRLSWLEHGTYRGVVEEASAPHLFCYRLAVDPEREPTRATSTLVEFRLAPAQLGTRVIVRESGFGASDDAADRIARSGAAWTEALERLAREFDGA
jgi:uncharacterized protein YndB with AHSA1/START domain